MSDSLRKGRGIWNVRAIPRWQIWCAGRPVMSSSRNRIEPAVGRSVPAIRLKVVLLPDPFGPMRPTISPSLTSKDTRLTARNPPKRLESSLAMSMFNSHHRAVPGAAQHEVVRLHSAPPLPSRSLAFAGQDSGAVAPDQRCIVPLRFAPGRIRVTSLLRTHGVDGRGGQRQHGLLGLNVGGPNHGDVLASV